MKVLVSLPLAAPLLSILVGCGATPQDGPDSTTLFISGGTLIDGRRDEPLSDSAILIRDGKIAAVGPLTEVQAPANATVINASGKTVLPGFIDAHVHFRDYVAELYLNHGVTTVKDAGNPPDWILELRRLWQAGQMRGPRILSVGNIFDAPPVHRGHHIGLTDPEQARAETRKLINRGVDAIKVYQQVTPELVQAVSEEAHTLSKLVSGHIGFSAAEAARSGLDALEHASGIALALAEDPEQVFEVPAHRGVLGFRYADPEKVEALVQLLLDEDVTILPALANWGRGATAYREKHQQEAEALLTKPELANLSEGALRRVRNHVPDVDAQERAGLEKDFENLCSFLRAFSAAGGKIVAGPDTGVLYGLGTHHEMELLVVCGISPMEAIQSATIRAAEFLGLATSLGTIESGKEADLVIIEGDPLQDVTVTKNIRTVIQRGQIQDIDYHADYQIPISRPPVEGSNP